MECVGLDGGKGDESASRESPDGGRYGACVEEAGKRESEASGDSV